MDVRTQSTPVFRQVRRVAAQDTDELAHVNNVVWLRYVLDLAHEHSAALGLDFEAYRRIGGFWVVRRHEIDYHGNAGAGDEIVGETWVSQMRGARSLRHARFVRAGDGALLVTATTLWAFVDAVTLRPKRLPRDIAERFIVCGDGPRERASGSNSP